VRVHRYFINLGPPMTILDNDKELLEQNIKRHLTDLSLTNASRLRMGITILMNSGTEAFKSNCSNTVQNELAEFADIMLHPESLATQSCQTPEGREEVLQFIKQFSLDNLALLDKRTSILPNVRMTTNIIKGQGHLKAVVHSSALFNVITAAHFVDAIEKKLTEQNIDRALIPRYIQSATQSMIRLHQAVIEGDITTIKQELSIPGVDVNYPNEDGLCFLHLAVRENHLDVVKLLLTKPDIHVNQVSNNGWTALHIAARLGNNDIIKELLKVPGINVNFVNSDGWTALHWAAWNGNFQVVNALLSNPEIDINKTDKNGTTALHWAARNGHGDIIISLLAHLETHVNPVDIEGKTPLHYACMYDHFQAVLSLIASPNIDPNPLDNDGMTPLHWGARGGNIDIVNVLCSLPNIDENVLDSNQMTPLDYAIRGGFTNIVRKWANPDIVPIDSDPKSSLLNKIKRLFRRN